MGINVEDDQRGNEDRMSLFGPRKLGLALGSGGARGLAHIGVLRALESEGLNPDVITGSSMGAIVGSLYAAGVSLDKMDAFMAERKKEYGAIAREMGIVKK